MDAATLNAAGSQIINTGVIGALLIIAVWAVYYLVRRSEEKCAEDRKEMVAALNKERDKLVVVLEGSVVNSTAAMNNMADVAREHKEILQRVKCLDNAAFSIEYRRKGA